MVRRSIEITYADQYPGFCGWDNLCSVVDGINDYETMTLFVGYFVTGARAMELPYLRYNQIDLNYSKKNIMVYGMKVEKHRTKEYLKSDDLRLPEMGAIRKDYRGEYRLKPTKASRSFTIRKDDPLGSIFIEFLEKFSDRDNFARNTILFPYKYGQISYRINLIGVTLPKGYYKKGWWSYKGDWWCHRIRAEKACQLRRDLKYDRKDLMDWFGWKTAHMADIYAKMVPFDLAVEREIDWK